MNHNLNLKYKVCGKKGGVSCLFDGINSHVLLYLPISYLDIKKINQKFIVVLQYASDSFLVKLNENDSYPGEPGMLGIFDNFFVGLL